jgi:altronate dehydratase
MNKNTLMEIGIRNRILVLFTVLFCNGVLAQSKSNLNHDSCDKFFALDQMKCKTESFSVIDLKFSIILNVDTSPNYSKFPNLKISNENPKLEMLYLLQTMCANGFLNEFLKSKSQKLT